MLPMDGIEAYRATLRTMAAIEAGGSGDDDADFRRLVARIAPALHALGGAGQGEASAADRGASRRTAAASLANTIAAAIGRLAAAEQIILQLSLVDNCSLAEIGSILDLAPLDIAKARRAAIGHLRRDLATRVPA